MGRHWDLPLARPGRRALATALLSLAALVPAGCACHSSPTTNTVPRHWRGLNPWGPEAEEARAEGLLKPAPPTPKMAEWVAFAHRHIEEGDFLFRYGISYDFSGRITANVVSDVADSPFSHDAVAHWEGDTLFVYDTVPDPEGVRKIPFEYWVLDNAPHSFAIKRLRPEFRGHIPAAMAFIDEAYQRQVPFDSDLRLDDERFYCSELIEKAYRSAGLALSEPV